MMNPFRSSPDEYILERQLLKSLKNNNDAHIQIIEKENILTRTFRSMTTTGRNNTII